MMPRGRIHVRVVRGADEAQEELEGLRMSPAERLEAVWALTMICHAWTNEDEDEPRLQRSVVRIQRPRR